MLTPIAPPNEDEGLSPANHSALNREFYDAHPYEYFQLRMLNLVVQAGAAEHVANLATEGLEYRGIPIRQTEVPGYDDVDDEESQRRLDAFVITETLVLYHHVGEALLRLYLGHRGWPACPPLEVARITSPRRFKDLVRSSLVDRQPERDELAELFLLTSSPSQLNSEAATEDAWSTSVDNLSAWLRHYAKEFDEQAHAYNAAKHGLAVLSGVSTIQMLSEATNEPVLGHEGPAVNFISLRDVGDDARRWHRSVEFIDLQFTWTAISNAIRMLRALFGSARYRYLDVVPSGVLLWPEGDSPAEVVRRIREAGAGTPFSRLYFSLEYDQRDN